MNDSFVKVLLIEDDVGDIELTREALADSKLHVDLQVVRDGAEAITYLHQGNTVLPDLILLDLNLPRKNGHEVLREIRSDEKLKHIPIAVLTTSDADEDILQAYRLGANCYVSKPVGMDEFNHLVQQIESFWFTVVKLPPRSVKGN